MGRKGTGGGRDGEGASAPPAGAGEGKSAEGGVRRRDAASSTKNVVINADEIKRTRVGPRPPGRAPQRAAARPLSPAPARRTD